MGRSLSPRSRAEQLSAFDAATSGSKALLDDADAGLQSIRADVASLRERRHEAVPAPAPAYVAPVSPMSRLVPHGRFHSVKIGLCGAVLGVFAAWTTGFLSMAPSDDTAMAGNSAVDPVRPDKKDWIASWQPAAGDVLPSAALATAIGGISAARLSAPGGPAEAASAPERAARSRDGVRGQVARRVLATRATTSAPPAAAGRQWTGTFFAK